jgi:S1-C subfamily serine protease
VNASGGPNLKYVATLTLAAVLILTVGWFIRPRNEAAAPAERPSEGELARLARLAERRSLENMTAYFAGVAEDVDSSVVRTPTGDATGLVWNGTTIVTAYPKHPGSGDVMPGATAGGPPSDAADWGPHVPVTAMRRPDTALALSPVHRRTTAVEPGDWVVAVWRTREGRAFAMGTALQTARLTCGTISTEEVLCSLPLSETMTGGGLFDAAGSLVGVIASCGDRVRAITPGGVDAMLARAATAEQQLLIRFGLVAGALDPDERAYFEPAEGVLVREVWTGSPSDAAGLEPGDLILSLDGTPLAAPDRLAPLAASERMPATLGIRRGRRPLTISVPASGAASDPKTGPAPTVGLLWEPPARGFPVETVVPGSAAARAGITSGDRIVRVDGAAPRSQEQAERLLAAYQSRPVFVTIERGRRRLGVVLH